MTPDKQAVERALVDTLNEQASGSCRQVTEAAPGTYWYGGLMIDIGALARAAIAALAQPVSGDVEGLVERLRRYVDAIERKDSGKDDPPPLHVGPMMCANAMDEAADMLEALARTEGEGW